MPAVDGTTSVATRLERQLDRPRTYPIIDRLFSTVLSGHSGDSMEPPSVSFTDLELAIVADQADTGATDDAEAIEIAELKAIAELASRIREFWLARSRVSRYDRETLDGQLQDLMDELTPQRDRMRELLMPWDGEVMTLLIELQAAGILRILPPRRLPPVDRTVTTQIQPRPTFMPGPSYRPGWWHQGAVAPIPRQTTPS